MFQFRREGASQGIGIHHRIIESIIEWLELRKRQVVVRLPISCWCSYLILGAWICSSPSQKAILFLAPPRMPQLNNVRGPALGSDFLDMDSKEKQTGEKQGGSWGATGNYSYRYRHVEKSRDSLFFCWSTLLTITKGKVRCRGSPPILASLTGPKGSVKMLKTQCFTVMIFARLGMKDKPWSDLTLLFITSGTRPHIFNTNGLGHWKSTCEAWLSLCCLHGKVTFWFSLSHQIHDFRSSFKHVCNITLTIQYLRVNTCQLLWVIFFLLERRSKQQCKCIRGKKWIQVTLLVSGLKMPVHL